MSRIKTFIIIGLIGAIVLVIFLINSSSKNIAKTPKEETKVDTPLLEDKKTDLPVKIDNKISFNTPEELPLITFRFKNITADKARQIATDMGFDFEPTIINDITEGTKYLWNSDEYGLWITPQTGLISYSRNDFDSLLTGTKLSTEDFQKLANDYLSKLGLTPIDTGFTSLRYLRIAGNPDAGFIEGTKDNAKLIQLNYTYRTTGYPILTHIPQFHIIYIQFYPDGKLFRSDVYMLENFKPSIEKKKIMNFEEIKKNLRNAKLVSLENDYISENDVTRDMISTIEVDKIMTAYVFDKTARSRTLYPVFLLSGNIKVKDSTASYANLYLPAMK